jgi:hypothetical protein
LKKIRTTVPRGTETTIRAVAISQKMQMRHFEIYTKNEGKCWTEFYKYVKGRKGNRENIPTIKVDNGLLITDSVQKANSLISIVHRYSTVSVISRKYRALTQVNPSPLVLKSLGKGSQR